MVARIVDACEDILIADGYAAASTNRIAAQAGISKGSLYQYFPDKDAVVLAVLRRLADAVAADVLGRFADASDLAPRQALEFAVSTMLDVEQANRALLRVVMEEMPRLDGFDKMRELIDTLVGVADEYLRAHRDQLRDDVDVETASWLIVETALRVSFQYVLAAKPPMPQAQFTSALVDMLVRYCLV